ncbi:hypothetical protein MDA_GLEAN10017066 [Myotis davidii]|uniref:Uncharacterized protein n=1 Tax=Myotis davidii TaxID=225400 RepID=L5LHA6_MYODS|nr:hypothetical protein MDA_GLEAN10017066 [Myotis davidii]
MGQIQGEQLWFAQQRPEIDIEKATGVADPGLSFVGQGRLESKEVEVVVHKRKEVEPGWNGQMGGPGSEDLAISWKLALFLACSTGIELASGHRGSYLAPFLPSEAAEPTYQMLQNLPAFAAHLCK